MDVDTFTHIAPFATPPNSLTRSLRTIWHKSAPKSVRKAFRSGRPSKGWSAWTKHLAGPDRPLPLRELLPGNTSPLVWCLPDQAANGGAPDLLDQIDRLGSKGRGDRALAERMVLSWLADTAGTSPRVCYAAEALAWCHALPRLAGKLTPDVWYDLLEHLLGTVSDAQGIELEHDPLVHQMLSGELPLALRYLFPELVPCRRLGRVARRQLSAGLVDLLDGEGLPHARHLGLLRPLLACWTRCRAMAGEWSKPCWSDAAQTQYEWLILGALRLTRHDGTHVFSRGPSGAWCKALFRAAVAFSQDGENAAIAALVLPACHWHHASATRRGADGKRAGKRALPKAATHSEWAAVGVLRPGWRPADPRLVTTYADLPSVGHENAPPNGTVAIELECKHAVIWSGQWKLEVRRDGRLLRPDSHWEEVCWVSDRDVDYLELEIELEGRVRVQRHMLLAREDRVLLLADAILGERPARLEYRGCLPLAEGISFRQAEETWEGFLVGRRRLALALPVALPEWQVEPGAGSLAETERGLELCQQAHGRSMFCPLLFDLKRGRMTRRLTWRRLCVAENLEIQPDDVAVGYRVMIGNQQWLIYRSLARRGNRTLLGHNLSTEMLVARFDRTGEVEPLLEIE